MRYLMFIILVFIFSHVSIDLTNIPIIENMPVIESDMNLRLLPMPMPASIWVSDLVSVPVEIPKPGKIPYSPPFPEPHGSPVLSLDNDMILVEYDKIVMPPVKRAASGLRD